MEVSSKMLLHHDHMGGIISKLVRYSGFPKARSPNIDHPNTMILLIENPPQKYPTCCETPIWILSHVAPRSKLGVACPLLGSFCFKSVRRTASVPGETLE